MAVGSRSRKNIKETLRYEKERDRERSTKPLIRNIDADDESDGEVKLSKLIKDTRGKREKQSTKKEILEIQDEVPVKTESSDVKNENKDIATPSQDNPETNPVVDDSKLTSITDEADKEIKKESSVIDKEIEEMEKTRNTGESKISNGKVIIDDKNKSSKPTSKVYEKEKRFVEPEEESEQSDDRSGSEDDEDSEYISEDEQLSEEVSVSSDDDVRNKRSTIDRIADERHDYGRSSIKQKYDDRRRDESPEQRRDDISIRRKDNSSSSPRSVKNDSRSSTSNVRVLRDDRHRDESSEQRRNNRSGDNVLKRRKDDRYRDESPEQRRDDRRRDDIPVGRKNERSIRDESPERRRDNKRVDNGRRDEYLEERRNDRRGDDRRRDESPEERRDNKRVDYRRREESPEEQKDNSLTQKNVIDAKTIRKSRNDYQNDLSNIFGKLEPKSITKLLKHNDVAHVSGDVFEEITHITRDFVDIVFDELIREEINLINNNHIELIMSMYLKDEDQELPDQVFLDAREFERAIGGIVHEKRIGIKKNAVYTLQLLVECVLGKVIKGARIISKGVQRARTTGVDLRSSFQIYML